MRSTFLIGLIVLSLALPAVARTKLAALPGRESVTVRLDNERATLIEEERVLTLSEGENLVDFSWRGVRVEPDSLRLTFLTHPDKVRLLSTGYPFGEEALVWRVASEGAWEERVRVSYLLAAIDRLVEYRAVAARDEKTLDISSYLVLRNFSGELIDDALFAPGGDRTFQASSASGETRKVLLAEAKGVPIKKVLVWDADVQPWEAGRADETPSLPVYYRIENNTASNLGVETLRGGKVRVHQEDGHGGTIFLGEDRAQMTPVNGKLSLQLGESREVAVTLRKTDEKRTNPRPSRQVVKLYDADEAYALEVENFKDSPVSLEIVQRVPGEWNVANASAAIGKKDAETLLIKLELEAKANISLDYALSRRNLRN